jgi:hypothetical protein
VSAATADYSGIRSLSGVLESQQVIRKMREASLAEAAADCVYASTSGGRVTAFPIARHTNTRVYFGDRWYVRREFLEQRHYAYVPDHPDDWEYVYASPGLAEALAGAALPDKLPDWRDEDDKARDQRETMRFCYRRYHEAVDELQQTWFGLEFITGEEAAAIHVRIDAAVKERGYWDDDLPAHWWRDESRQEYERRRQAS